MERQWQQARAVVLVTIEKVLDETAQVIHAGTVRDEDYRAKNLIFGLQVFKKRNWVGSSKRTKNNDLNFSSFIVGRIKPYVVCI